MKQIIVSLILLLASGFAAHASDPNPQPAPTSYAMWLECGMSIIVPPPSSFSDFDEARLFYDALAEETCGYSVNWDVYPIGG